MQTRTRLMSSLQSLLDIVQFQAASERCGLDLATLSAGVRLVSEPSAKESVSQLQLRACSSSSASTSYQCGASEDPRNNADASDPSSRAPCKAYFDSLQNSANRPPSWKSDALSMPSVRTSFDGCHNATSSSLRGRSLGERYQHTQARNEEQIEDKLSASQTDQPTVQPSPASQLQVCLLALKRSKIGCSPMTLFIISCPPALKQGLYPH